MPSHDLPIKAMRSVSHQQAGGAAPFNVLADLFHKCAEQLTKRARMKRTTQDLENLSDHMLKDIGLTRYDVYHSHLPPGSHHL